MSDERFKGLMIKHPCIGCIYFAKCGSTTRTEKCYGRVTKSEKAKVLYKEVKLYDFRRISEIL